jgi:hypothetical protein
LQIPCSLLGEISLLRALNLLLGVFGYAVAVVDSIGRNPGLVGIIVVMLVVVVVLKESVSVEVVVTTAASVSVVVVVDVVEKVSVIALFVVVTVTCTNCRVRISCLAWN